MECIKKGKLNLSGALKSNPVSFLFFISSIMVAIISISVITMVNRTVKMVENATQNHLLAAAWAASTFLTVEELDLFHTKADMERPEWEALRIRLKEFAGRYQVKYVYYWRHYGAGLIQYIIDNDDEEEEKADPAMIYDIAADSVTGAAVPVILSGNAWASDLGAYTAARDRLISGMAPVFNADGSVYCAAGADLSDEIIMDQRRNMVFLRTILLCSLGLSLLSGSLGMWFYRRKALQSENANQAKGRFLSTVSDEIRTPMNAIIGMGELALRADVPPQITEYIHGIKQAGATLLSMVNDILDFSKIEAGRLEILPVQYSLASLVNDVINITRMRITEKSVRFVVNIEPSLPSRLFGDETRVRQILLNLLNNAVKHTEKGFISLSITRAPGGNKAPQNQVRLKIIVADSGTGIKPEDQEKLFDDFAWADSKKNRGGEGMGLGLAIAKRLCAAMDGNLSVSSVYGEGSSFTALISQGISLDVPFALVEAPEEKRTLVCERRAIVARSICWSLEKLAVPYTLVTDEESLYQSLRAGGWFYVFCGYCLYDRILPLVWGLRKRPGISLLVERDIGAPLPQTRLAFAPTHSLSIANALNNVEDDNACLADMDQRDGLGAVKYIAPSARILMVDDVLMNLKVARGLLAPYQAAVDTCLNGSAAMDMVTRCSYDIIFLDYMMPDMDGIEAAATIRAWEAERPSGQPVPIIALTAGAISGMKERLLSQGFNDYLIKPIDIRKLDELIWRWIPKEKQIKFGGNAGADEAAVPEIPGVDVERGIALAGGTAAGYRQALALFRADTEARLPWLLETPNEAGLSRFTGHARALKTAAALIGAMAVSTEAERLETAGKNADLPLIREALPGFVKGLAVLAEGIRAALEASGGTPPG